MNRASIEVFNEIKANGVRLLLDGGRLRAKGGDFTPELQAKAKDARADLELLVRMEQSERENNLHEALAGWKAFATPERGFFIGLLQNAVTRELEIAFETAKADYLEGTGDLQAVHAAFNEFAKSTRRKYVNRQLMGSIFEPEFGGKRTSQEEIQRAFSGIESGQFHSKIERQFRSSVTPQIDLQEDQLGRMTTYFGITAAEHIAKRFDK